MHGIVGNSKRGKIGRERGRERKREGGGERESNVQASKCVEEERRKSCRLLVLKNVRMSVLVAFSIQAFQK